MGIRKKIDYEYYNGICKSKNEREGSYKFYLLQYIIYYTFLNK